MFTPDPDVDLSHAPRLRRVLLVDDNEEGRTALARLLEYYGFEVRSVGDGASALDALKTEPPPDVLLTDLLLPDLDGREIARAALDLEPPPVIALITGWSFDDEEPDPGRWGIQYVFHKPLNARDLVEVLRNAEPAQKARDGAG